MIKIEDIKVQLKNAKLKFDNKGMPFLNCKGFTFGTKGEEEKEELERLNEPSATIIKGKSWFTSIKIYGDLSELDKLLEEFEKEDRKMFITTLLNDSYLKTFLINGMLSTVLYCFNYKFKAKKKKKVKVISVKQKGVRKTTKKKVEKEKQIIPKALKELELKEDENFDFFD